MAGDEWQLVRAQRLAPPLHPGLNNDSSAGVSNPLGVGANWHERSRANSCRAGAVQPARDRRARAVE